MRRRLRGVQAGVLLSMALAGMPHADAQITTDGSLGPATSLSGTSVTIPSSLGQVRGGNLFHSFGQFNINTGQTATFTSSTGGISNVISRVTGGSQSVIDGLLRSTIGGANFYLINPSGIMFGPNASLDISGSFHASTAHYIGFPDGTRFSAASTQPPVLSFDPPSAFGFLGPTAPLVVDGSVLQMPEGKTLSLVGGNVQVSNAPLTAPSGRLQIGSVAGAGEIGLGTPEEPTLGFDGTIARGQIDISGSTLNVSDAVSQGLGASSSSGTIMIRGGRLVVAGSQMTASTLGDAAPIAIDVDITGNATLTGGSSLMSATNDLGAGGAVTLTAGGLVVEDASFIFSTTEFDGSAGAISVDVGTLSLTSGGRIDSNSGFGFGTGGDINVTLRESGVLSGFGTGMTSDTIFLGNGGQVTISGPSASLTVMDDAAITTRNFGEGVGGNILVDVARLRLAGGGNVTSRAAFLGPGGQVTINARDTLAITGVGSSPSGIFAGSSDDGSFLGDFVGFAGEIVVTAGALSLTDGGLIQSGFIFDPEAGNVTVTGTRSIFIGDRSTISSQAFTQPVASVTVSTPSLTIDGGSIEASTIGPGRAGDIAIDVSSLTLRNGGQIANSSALSASGDGGNLTVTAGGAVSISGSSPDGVPRTLFSNDPSSGLFSITQNTGNAGQIVVMASGLSVTDGGKISVATAGDGAAGSIVAIVGQLVLGSGARIDSGTMAAGAGGSVTLTAGSVGIDGGAGLFSSATADGAGGNIDVNSGEFALTGGALVAATSSGTGNAGNIVIDAGSVFHSIDSAVTTQALVADGGNITILADQIFRLSNSQVTTSVQSGVGAGGNILIDPDFIILNGSQIRADAFGGPGGNVLIVGDVFLSSNSIVSASSALGAPGTVSIQATVTDVSGGLTSLPEGVLEAAAFLRASCATRLSAGKASSLLLAGREALPLEPGGLLPSPLLVAADELPASSQSGDVLDGLPRLSLALFDSKCGR